MLGLPGQVVDVVRIGLHVIQLLGRLRLPEPPLGLVQLPGPIRFLPGPHRRGLPQVGDVLGVDLVGHIVADVAVLLVAHRAHQVEPLVHPPPEGVGVLPRGRLLLPYEGLALHMARHRHPRQA